MRCAAAATSSRSPRATPRHSPRLRAAGAAYRARQDKVPDDTAVNDGGSTVVLSVWQYIGCGCLNPGDVLLAAGIEASYAPPEKRCLDLRREPPNQRQPIA